MRAEEFEKINTGAFQSIMTPDVKELGRVFNSNGHEIRIVGGAVRDLALKKFPKDIDMATDATPDQMIDIFKSNDIRYKPTGLQHGTITAILNDTPYEITTLRADVDTDGRRAKVKFVKDWKADAKRRDLTYNAMSIDFKGKIYDYYGGMDHLQDKVSQFVGDPNERIQEDYLRILRYFRFQSKLEDPKWDGKTLEAIKNNKDGLSRISVERVWSEVSKMLISRNPEETLKYFATTGIDKVIGLPVTNANSLARLEPTKNPIVPLAVLVSNPEIGKRWKMSTEQLNHLNFLTAHKAKVINKESAIELINAGNPKKYVMDLLNIKGKYNIVDVIRTYEKPVFPLQGRDLLAKGMKPGIEVGNKLNDLKSRWKSSGYKLTKPQLLNLLPKNK